LNRKIKKQYILIRVLTDSNSFKWHILNNIDGLMKQYRIYIIGDDVEVFQKEFPSVKFINLKIKRKPSFISDFIALIKLIYYFLSIRPDIVHSIMPKSGLLSAIAGFITMVPIRIHTFTGQVWSTRTGIMKYLYLKFDSLINSLNTICLTDSNSQSKFLKEHNISYNNNNLPVLNKGSICGVDLQKIDKVLSKDNSETQELLKKTYNIDKNDFIFTYLARKTKDKGAIDILKAFEKVCNNNQGKNLKLFFIGPYEEKIDTISYIKKFSDRVIDIGKVDNHLEFLSISNVLCLPSYREGFGSIVIDAAALKVPSIGYDVPGLQDSIINNKTGLLSKKGDILAFEKYMNLMHSDNQFREKLGMNAHTYAVNNFSSKVMSQYYDKLYKELISS